MEEGRQNGNKVSSAVMPEENLHKKVAVKKHYILLTNDDTVLTKLKCFAAELLGTFILVFVGCMSCIEHLIPPPLSIITISFIFGIAVLIAVQTIGHISGAHINPAVTLAAVLLGYMPLINIPIYWLAQTIGSLAGYGVLYGVVLKMHVTNSTSAYCVNHIAKDISTPGGFVVEFLITMMLVWTVCGIWDVRNATRMDSVPVKLGLIIAGLAMAAIPFSSASMNPARSLGPAVIGRDFEDLWVFLIAPLCGGAFGALLYRFLFEVKLPQEAI